MKISLKDIYESHDKALEEFGGEDGVRDSNLIESAYYSAFQGFGDNEFYQTPEEKAARLGFGLAVNHGFVDGNKRTGLAVLLLYLDVNGLILEATQDELVDIFIKIAESPNNGYEKLLSFVKDHIKKG